MFFERKSRLKATFRTRRAFPFRLICPSLRRRHLFSFWILQRLFPQHLRWGDSLQDEGPHWKSSGCGHYDSAQRAVKQAQSPGNRLRLDLVLSNRVSDMDNARNPRFQFKTERNAGFRLLADSCSKHQFELPRTRLMAPDLNCELHRNSFTLRNLRSVSWKKLDVELSYVDSEKVNSHRPSRVRIHQLQIRWHKAPGCGEIYLENLVRDTLLILDLFDWKEVRVHKDVE
jgi:hypothetical protein